MQNKAETTISVTNVVSEDYDVFISYSRRNQLFVEALYDILVNEYNLRCWLDTEAMDGKPSIDWWTEIKANIANCLVFMPIISPHLMNSEPCNAEIAYALELGKQIFPIEFISIEKVDEERFKDIRFLTPDVLETAPRTNWGRLGRKQFSRISNIPVPAGLSDQLKAELDVRYHDYDLSRQLRLVMSEDLAQDFTFGKDYYRDLIHEIAPTLAAAIRHSPDYYQRLRPFLEMASHWNPDTHEGYLRGGQLKQVQALYTESLSNKYEFGDRMTQYMFESQAAQSRRQRLIIGLVSVAVIIMSILAIAAVLQTIEANVQRNEANTQRNEANTQRDIAIENELERNRQLQTLVLADAIFTVNDDGRNPIGFNPSRPLLAGQYLWVSNREGNDVVQLRADTGAVVTPSIVVGENPTQPVTDGRYIYVASISERSISRIDPEQTGVVDTITLSNIPQQIIPYSPLRLWVITDRSAIEINVETWTVIRNIEIGRGLTNIVHDDQYAYFSESGRGNIYQLILETGNVLSASVGEDTAQKPVLMSSSVWIASAGNLYEFSPNGFGLLSTTALATQISTPQVVQGMLWMVATMSDGSEQLVRLDPTTHQTAIVDLIGISSYSAGLEALTVNRIFGLQDQILVIFEQGWLAGYDTNGVELWNTPVTGATNLSEPVFDGANMWLANSQSRIVYVLDPETGVIERRIPVCTGPTRPVFDGANMWISCVASGEKGTVNRIPAFLLYHAQGEGQISELVDFDANSRAHQPIFDGQRLWIIQEADGYLIVYDIYQNCTIGSLYLGPYPPLPHYDPATRHYWITTEQGSADLYQLLAFDVDRFTTCGQSDLIPQVSMRLDNEAGGLTRIKNYLLVAISTPSVTEAINLNIANMTEQTIHDEHRFAVRLFPTGYWYEADTNSIWLAIAGETTSRLEQWDADSFEVRQSVVLNYLPWTPLLLGDDVWVSGALKGGAFTGGTTLLGDNTGGGLLRLDKSTLTAELELEFDRSPSRIVYAGGLIWASFTNELPILTAFYSRGYSDLTAFNTETGNVEASFDFCENFHVPYYDETTNYLWITCIGTTTDPGDILVLDLSPTNYLQTVHFYSDLGTEAWYPVKINQDIWVVYRGTGNAIRFDATTALIRQVYGLGTSPSPPTQDADGNIWIANSGDATLQRISID